MGARVDPEVAAAHARLLRDASIQFHAYEGLDPALFSWVRFLRSLFQAVGPLGGWIILGTVILALGALLYPVARRLFRGAAPEAPSLNLAGALVPPSRARARALLEEADRLAALGQYGDAARVLLTRSIQDVEAQRPKSIPKSATAREIARLPVLSEDARICFSAIALAVERFAFAGAPMDRSAFDRCRTLYADFALPAAWSTSKPSDPNSSALGSNLS